LTKDNCQAISIAIQNGMARAISNGSYGPLTLKRTSSLTIVAARNDKDPLDGDNWVPGTSTDQSAYRSELAGIAGILSVVAIIIQHYDINKGSITIALDGYWKWVEGHQDKKGKFMDWWALQNQKVDQNAKAFLKKCKQTK
jgi:hypothetical protein